MCKKVRDLIDLYVAGDLQPREAEKVEGHLAQCEACSREAASYRTCLEELAALSSKNQPNRLSPFFWQGIQKEILTAKERVEPGPSRVRRVLYALAAAILIAVTAYLGVWLFGESPGTPTGSGNGPPIVEMEGGSLLPPWTPLLPEKDEMVIGSDPQEKLEF